MDEPGRPWPGTVAGAGYGVLDPCGWEAPVPRWRDAEASFAGGVLCRRVSGMGVPNKVFRLFEVSEVPVLDLCLLMVMFI